MNLIRRIIHFYLHFNDDFPTVRERRSYLLGVQMAKRQWYPDMALPAEYRLTSVSEVQDSEPYWHNRVLRDRIPDRRGPVGVRMDLSGNGS